MWVWNPWFPWCEARVLTSILLIISCIRKGCNRSFFIMSTAKTWSSSLFGVCALLSKMEAVLFLMRLQWKTFIFLGFQTSSHVHVSFNMITYNFNTSTFHLVWRSLYFEQCHRKKNDLKSFNSLFGMKKKIWPLISLHLTSANQSYCIIKEELYFFILSWLSTICLSIRKYMKWVFSIPKSSLFFFGKHLKYLLLYSILVAIS